MLTTWLLGFTFYLDLLHSIQASRGSSSIFVHCRVPTPPRQASSRVQHCNHISQLMPLPRNTNSSSTVKHTSRGYSLQYGNLRRSLVHKKTHVTNSPNSKCGASPPLSL